MRIHEKTIFIRFGIAAILLGGTPACDPDATDSIDDWDMNDATAASNPGEFDAPGGDADGDGAMALPGDVRTPLESLAEAQGEWVPLYRYWNPGIGDHFYTTNWDELGFGASGWNLEGIQCRVHTQMGSGMVPLYRYWNSDIGDHFYTTNWGELGYGASGWYFESVQGYVYPDPHVGTLPLYRYWNSGIGDHFYTTNWGELGAGASGWDLEGIQAYVMP